MDSLERHFDKDEHTMVNPNAPENAVIIAHQPVRIRGRRELRTIYAIGQETYVVESVTGAVTCPVSRCRLAAILGITREELAHRLAGRVAVPSPYDMVETPFD